MTEKLYDIHPYEEQFEATIVEIRKEDNKIDIILDKTLFFPNEGGQVCDRGSIDGIEVLHVVNKGGVHYHQVEELTADMMVGKKVKGIIDFEHRYDLMQQHSGEHVLSGIIYNTYGYHNVGFHLTEDIVTVDCSGSFTKEQIEELELRVNEIVISNQEIVGRYPSKEELEVMEYRSKKEIDGPIRIVSVGDFEKCACCAPHVRRTGEIGSIRIVSWENYKGGTRMEIKCGLRAAKDAIAKQKILKELIQIFSVPEKQIADAATKLKQENTALKVQIAKLSDELLECRSANIVPTDKIILWEEGLDGNAHRKFVNLLMEKAAKLVAVMVSTDEEDSYRYMIAGNDLDVKGIQEALKINFAAKGGGKPPMIQGTLIGNRIDVEEFLMKQ